MIALALLIAAAAPAGFQPPLDRALHFRTVQRGAGAAATRYSREMEVRFAPEAGGYLMSITMTRVDSTARGAQARLFALTASPFVGTAMRFHLSAAGAIVGVDEPDALWSAMLTGLDRTLAAKFPAGPVPPEIKAFRAQLAATPPDGRTAILLDNAEALLAPPLAAGNAPLPFSDQASDASGHPVLLKGELRRLPDAPDAVHFVAEADSGKVGQNPQASIREDRDLAVSRADGLLVHARRTVRALGGAVLMQEDTDRLPS